MDESIILLTIFGMALVTYLPRALPLFALSGKKLPKWMVSWLRYIPPAVLAAMLFPTILFQEEKINLSLDNLYLWAAIPTLIAAVLTKKLFIPVIIGMLVVILARLFI
ncbi:MAG: AzlD domain-containing protein [Anaerolineales bacterium]